MPKIQWVNLLRHLREHLFDRAPEYCSGYRVFWEAVAKCDGEDQRNRAIDSALTRFAGVPQDHRTEDFYSAFTEGLKLRNRSDEAQRITKEGIVRFPRGSM